MEYLEDGAFERLIAAGIKAVPERFLKMLKNVAIVIEEEPTPEQRRKMRLRKDETLFGLYQGVAQTARDSNYFGVLPDKITIFKRPILQAAADERLARAIVRDTVWHEIAHHFGMEEHRVRRAENRRALEQKRKR